MSRKHYSCKEIAFFRNLQYSPGEGHKINDKYRRCIKFKDSFELCMILRLMILSCRLHLYHRDFFFDWYICHLFV